MENKSNDEKIEPEQSINTNKKINVFICIKTAWKILEKIIMIVIIFISIVIVTQNVSKNEKAFLGFRIFRVQTGSMIPVYNIGDVILVKEKKLDKIAIGDDITYWGTSGAMKGKLVTHRVIGIEEIEGQRAFHTQGVANTAEDPIVFGNQINGVVLGKSHVLSSMTILLTNQYALYFCAILPLTIIVFLAFAKSKRFE